MFLLAFMGLIVNPGGELTFIIFPFQIVYLLVLSYCVYKITERLAKRIDFYVISKYFILTLIFQAIIAVAMFVSEPICTFLFDLQGIDRYSAVIQAFIGRRLIGLGCFYFGAGIIYGLGLITLIPFLLNAEKSTQLTKIVLIYIVIFVVGVFFARTSLVGCAFSIAYLVWCSFMPSLKRRAVSAIKYLVIIIIVMFSSLVIIYNTSTTLQEDYGRIVEFGFEAFINYSESGELSTKSSDGLKDHHLQVLPDDVKTYLLGDTKWTNGESYYKGVDVGYTRLLFYFGIFGTLMFVMYQYIVTRASGNLYDKALIKVFFRIVFFYTLVLLIKGYSDVASLLFIYLHYNNNSIAAYENNLLCRRIE